VRADKPVVILAFTLAGLVAGLYAVYFLAVGNSIHRMVVSRKIGTKMEEWLKGMG
jgi:hypothetical protein